MAMGSFTLRSIPLAPPPRNPSYPCSRSRSRIPSIAAHSGVSVRPHGCILRLATSDQVSSEEGRGRGRGRVQELRVPQAWSIPSIALKESEWLRETLHKWLDDEYCPEPTNIDISRVAAKSFYESLMSKETDLGEILLRMITDLEKLSYRESFHGPFSSANAAVRLITEKIGTIADN
ncbi:plant/protein [Carex rostrata]